MQGRRPNGSPPIPQRSLRSPDDVWESAKAEAERRGETLTAAINDFLIEYAQGTHEEARP